MSAPLLGDRAVAEDAGSVEAYGVGGLRGLLANPYVSACAAFAALGGLLFGYDQGVVSIILVMPQFLDRFPSVAPAAPGSGFYKGLLTAMIELGALLGALNQGWIADKFSRKYSIVLAVCVFTIGSILQGAAIDFRMLLSARFVGGVGIGMLSMVAPLYISEISPPESRGALLVLEEFSIVSGIVVAFCITYSTRYVASEWAWRLPLFLQIIPGLVLAVGACFLLFSPRWLAAQHRDGKALLVLSELRQLPTNDERVRQEWCDIRTEVALHNEISMERYPGLQDPSLTSRLKLELLSWMDLMGEGCWRRTHVGMGLMFFQQFVGINALIYYSPTLFETMGLDYDMQLVMSGVLNLCQLVGVTFSIWSMDQFGRRPHLLWGSVCMTIAQTSIAALVGVYSKDWAGHRVQGWTSVIFLLFYMVSFGATWGPVPWAMPAEIFPSSLRGKGVALSTASNWCNNFVIGLITPPLVEATAFGAYVFFAGFCFLSFIWTYYVVPETSGRTLEQMDAVFRDATGVRDELRRQRIKDRMLSADS